MRYLFFNPFSRQYYFPENFKRYTLFKSFYQYYTFSGWLIWEIWYHSSFFRNLFCTKNASKFLLVKNLSQYVSSSSILAFNRGSNGIEQKTTILGIDIKTNNEFFIKYAEKPIARINVNNEGNILQKLNNLDFVPKLQQHIEESDFCFIQTNVLKGERLSNQNMDKELLGILFQLSNQKIYSKRDYQSTVKNCFAHGDFCPWNIMVYNNHLQVFDWEMAGSYPIGYDLFTYIFQTSFLLTPKKNFDQILKQSEKFIKGYFQELKITDWQAFLIAFADIKCKLESAKKTHSLINQYQKLMLYAQKI